MALTLPEAQLAGVILETCIYGLYLVSLVACVHVLCFAHGGRAARRSGLNRPLLLVVLILMISITTHWILDVDMLFDAFIRDPEGPLGYYANASNWKNLVENSAYLIADLCADVILVYRLWVVWNYEAWVTILPICSSISTIVGASGLIRQFSLIKGGSTIFTVKTGPWVATTLASGLITNVYCTAFIAYRIWRIDSVIRALSHSRLRAFAVVMMETAGLYTMFVATTLIGYFAKSNVQYISVLATASVIGFSFNIVVVRMGLGISYKASHTTSIGETTFDDVIAIATIGGSAVDSRQRRAGAGMAKYKSSQPASAFGTMGAMNLKLKESTGRQYDSVLDLGCLEDEYARGERAKSEAGAT